MNKGELIESVAAELGESKATAVRAVEAVIHAIARGVKQDDTVTIVGFGTFTKRQRKARTGRNPATGQTMQIEAMQTVGFRPSAVLKSELRLRPAIGVH